MSKTEKYTIKIKSTGFSYKKQSELFLKPAKIRIKHNKNKVKLVS